MKITHSTANSKDAKQGSIFFARKGEKFDGHDFVKQAISQGATCVYYSSKLPFEIINYPNVEFIFNKNLEENLPFILKEIYDIPSKLVGITGTNGKTSTAFFGMQMFGMLGKKAGFVGTLGAFICDNLGENTRKNNIEKLEESELTTPDIISFYRILANFKAKGVEIVFFEASSIGLFQKRLAGIGVDFACFTNFTQDHLDFHKTMEEYFEAKILLFKNHLKPAGKILAGEGIFPKLQGIFPDCKRLIEVTEESITPEGISFKVGGVSFAFNLFGRFQIENLRFLISIALSFGFSLSEISKVGSQLKAPKGRLECVKKCPYIFVDYAHTPDSLEKAILTLKEGLKGRLFVLFGCGGERDPLKRRLMGEIAFKLADFTIITDDNPRGESPEVIRGQILEGFETKENVVEIADRKKAIFSAIPRLLEDDILLIAGKGHENYQIIGEEKHDFDDAKCVKNFYG